MKVDGGAPGLVTEYLLPEREFVDRPDLHIEEDAIFVRKDYLKKLTRMQKGLSEKTRESDIKNLVIESAREGQARYNLFDALDDDDWFGFYPLYNSAFAHFNGMLKEINYNRVSREFADRYTAEQMAVNFFPEKLVKIYTSYKETEAADLPEYLQPDREFPFVLTPRGAEPEIHAHTGREGFGQGVQSPIRQSPTLSDGDEIVHTFTPIRPPPATTPPRPIKVLKPVPQLSAEKADKTGPTHFVGPTSDDELEADMMFDYSDLPQVTDPKDQLDFGELPPTPLDERPYHERTDPFHANYEIENDPILDELIAARTPGAAAFITPRVVAHASPRVAERMSMPRTRRRAPTDCNGTMTREEFELRYPLEENEELENYVFDNLED